MSTPWTDTFARFRPGRVSLGRVAVQVADWTRPQPGRAPIFVSAWLDRLCGSHPGYVCAIYGPVGLLTLFSGVEALSIRFVATAYVAGYVLWSLAEYLSHRLSLHFTPGTRRQLAWAYMIHGVHHAYPEDSRRWVTPLVVSLPLAALLYLLCIAVLGPAGNPVFAGFIHGYLTYDLLHYFMHRGALPTAAGRFLRDHHLLHHGAAPERNFGVSSPLWDIVFRTRA